MRHGGQAVPEDEGEGQAVIETLSNEDMRELLSIGRDMAGFAGDAGRDKQNPGLSRVEATVSAVNDDGTLTVNLGSVAKPILRTYKMTSACYGAQVDDRVIVDTLNHITYITGILARDNRHYVKVAHGQTGITFANGSNTARAFVSADFTPTTIIACPSGAMPGYSCSTQIYDDGRAEIVMFRSGTSGQVTRSAFWALFA